MINSATQYPVHSLISHEGNTEYRVPPYQREYSWSKQQWEELFDDLVETESAHFLGTIICLNATVDAVDANVLELVDGQQRMTTITLLLAAIYSILNEHKESLDEDSQADLANLRRQLVRRQDGNLRLRPQKQGSNLEDYKQVMAGAGLPIEANWVSYFPLRKMSRCYEHFREEIRDYASDQDIELTSAAQQLLEAVNRAIIVKIEVSSHADAFVLFESLNNRGMPLTPVDLIKNHLLAVSERQQVLDIDIAFNRWNDMLSNLGDSYANHERFLRHYYNAFKQRLPQVKTASVATRSNLIRIYETLVENNLPEFLEGIVRASRVYGRITGQHFQDEQLDRELLALSRAQGAPSYVLLLFLLSEAEERQISETDLITIVKLLIDFFVRRNLTGFPQTYALPKLFMGIIEKIEDHPTYGIIEIVEESLVRESESDETFLHHLSGPIYEDNADVTRFVLTRLAETGMTKETTQDLWARESNRYIWTIEHILPQGARLPVSWQEMLGGPEAAAAAQAAHVHKLGNLTITGYNSSLGNKSFSEKKDRRDSNGNYIGYRNNLKLNDDVVAAESWSAQQIEARTAHLAQQILELFPLKTSR